MRTVKDRITQHNINAWDDTTEEAWITVNDCMYKILSKPDDASLGPTLNTWGVISGMASVYTCLVTPLRVSKMMIGFENNSLWGGWDDSLRIIISIIIIHGILWGRCNLL